MFLLIQFGFKCLSEQRSANKLLVNSPRAIFGEREINVFYVTLSPLVPSDYAKASEALLVVLGKRIPS